MSVGILHGVKDRIECMRVKSLLQPFLDGALDDGKRELVARHLEACHRCGLAASTYRALKNRLNDLGEPADPQSVARLEAFVDELDEDAAGPPPGDQGT